jgi:hypothetical protein
LQFCLTCFSSSRLVRAPNRPGRFSVYLSTMQRGCLQRARRVPVPARTTSFYGVGLELGYSFQRADPRLRQGGSLTIWRPARAARGRRLGQGSQAIMRGRLCYTRPAEETPCRRTSATLEVIKKRAEILDGDMSASDVLGVLGRARLLPAVATSAPSLSTSTSATSSSRGFARQKDLGPARGLS